MLKLVPASLLLGLAVAPTLHAQSVTPNTADPRSVRLEELASSYTKNNAFMGTVLVVEGDKVLLNQGSGKADLEWSIPNAPDVKFRLGSITSSSQQH